MHIRGRACDEKEGDRNAIDDDNDALRRVRGVSCASLSVGVGWGWGGGVGERSGAVAGATEATLAKGLRKRGAKRYRDDGLPGAMG